MSAPAVARHALAARLRAVATILLTDVPERAADPAEDSARLLTALLTAETDCPTDARVWLLLTGIAAAYPTRDDVDEARRLIEMFDADEASMRLLDLTLGRARSGGEPTASVEVVTGTVLVDVDFSARHQLHTGIQRVVRQTLPLWQVDREFTPVAWTTRRAALRLLTSAESDRVFKWFDLQQTPPSSTDDPPEDVPPRLIIPWKCVLLLAEVPPVDAAARIAAVGACSNNRLVCIGYDAIPLVSADLVPIEEPAKFLAHLSAIKFADRIAGISDSAAAEFRNFASMLATQGLAGPDVVSVPLPVTMGDGTTAPPAARDAGPARVLVVGSHDLRKNHLAVLHSAEMLWHEGIEFSLTFIGGGGSNLEFYHRVEALRVRGRKVEVRVAVAEIELRDAIAAARFTVFPSLHEGYGLPVAESIALGTPVITTEYGSTGEIVSKGGGLTVDPRNDADLVSAMRRLLTDDVELEALRVQIQLRSERSWQEYADELWETLVDPLP